LKGRRALVVGGTGGIGAALASALARRGAFVMASGRGNRHGTAEAAVHAADTGVHAAETGDSGPGSPVSLTLNIEKPGDLIGRLGEVGQIDIFAMAFGPFIQKPLDQTEQADWERLALLDLALPGAAASALLPGMMERGWGRFIFFGGTRTDAIRAYSSSAAYSAAKTGLGVLVKSIAAGYSDRDIGAILLCPGFVGTEYQNPGQKAALAARAPGGRLIDPASIGETAAELIAGDPCLASGAIINLDSGIKIGI